MIALDRRQRRWPHATARSTTRAIPLLLVSLLTAVLAVPTLARAQACGFSPGAVPDGSYKRTCDGCSVVGPTLSCDCLNFGRVPVHTAIDITLCRTDPTDPMANLNGVLTCKRCDARGACCRADSSCAANVTFTECQGDFQGENSTCEPTTCQPDEEIVTWVSGTGGDFGDPDNWEPAQVPDSGNTAKFDIDAAYPVTAATGSVHRLLVDRSDVAFSGGTLSADALTLAAPSIRVRGGGRLTLASGALQSSHAAIGDTAGAESRVEIDNAGTTWVSTGRVTVGAGAAGELTIDHAASVTSAESRIAEGADGTATVEDASSWTTGNIAIGVGSGVTGTLDILGGALVTTDDTAVIGLNTGSHGEVTVQGTGAAALLSTWSVVDTLKVGGAGTGSLTVDAGARVETDKLLVPDAAGANGEVHVTGVNLTANVRSVLDAATMNIGGDGTGSLSVEGGGQVNAVGTTNAVLIGPGGGTGTVLVRGVDHDSNLQHGELDVESGTLDIEDGGEVQGNEGAIGPAGVVIVRGTGVNGASRWQLETRLVVGTVGTGTVTFDGGLVRVPAGQLFVGTGGTIDGIGTIEEVQSGGIPAIEPLVEGTIAPGVQVVSVASLPPSGRSSSWEAVAVRTARAASFTPGALVIDGNPRFGPAGVLRVLVAGAGQSGVLHVTGDLTLDGTLEIAFVDGYAPKNGDAFTFLDVDGATTGDFTHVKLRGIAEGLSFRIDSAGGALTFTALSDGRVCTGAKSGGGIAECEICDNCIDDDGDGLVDRADPDCAPAANGLGLGIDGDATARKALLGCARTIVAAGANLAAATAKRLQTCAGAVFGCVEAKPGDAKCLDKAKTACTKATGALGADGAVRLALRKKIIGACGAKKAGGPPAVPVSALLDAKGLGYAAETVHCGTLGVTPLDGLDAVVACVERAGLCRATDLFAARVPRAGEVLALGGADSSVLACVPAGADGGGAGLADTKTLGKQAVKCQHAIAAGGAKLAAALVAAYETCAGATLACSEGLAADQATCLAKAHRTCAKATAGVATTTGTADAALAASLAKACGKLGIAAVRASVGLGFDARSPRCIAFGVPTVASLDAIATCLSREHACRAAQLGEVDAPRLRELLEAGGAPLE